MKRRMRKDLKSGGEIRRSDTMEGRVNDGAKGLVRQRDTMIPQEEKVTTAISMIMTHPIR